MNGFCKNMTTGGNGDNGDEEVCTDSDGGKNYFVKGTAIVGTNALSDNCNEDGTLTEKFCYEDDILWEKYECPDGCHDGACINLSNETCTYHSYYQCYDGNVHWFNSCNETEDIKEICDYGCEDNICIVSNETCTNHSYYQCYDGNVHWFNSCDEVEEEKEHCDYGCEYGVCLDEPDNETPYEYDMDDSDFKNTTDGYTSVTENSLYTEGSGFGWLDVSPIDGI